MRKTCNSFLIVYRSLKYLSRKFLVISDENTYSYITLSKNSSIKQISLKSQAVGNKHIFPKRKNKIKAKTHGLILFLDEKMQSWLLVMHKGYQFWPEEVF